MFLFGNEILCLFAEVVVRKTQAQQTNLTKFEQREQTPQHME